jgi:hypothetical protein
MSAGYFRHGVCGSRFSPHLCVRGQWRQLALRFHPPLGRVKILSEAKKFSGRGNVDAVPRPEILFSLSLKDNFDPP